MSKVDTLHANSQFSLPFFGAVVVHVLVAGLLFGSWTVSYKKPIEFEIPENIKAELVSIEKPKPEPVVQPKPKPVNPPKPKPPPQSTPKPKPVETPKPVEKPVVKETPKPEENAVDLSPEVVEPEIVAEQPVAEPETESQEPEDNSESLFEDLLANLAEEDTEIKAQIEEIERNNARNEEIKAQVSDYIVQITRQVEEKWSRPVELRLMDLSNIEAIVAVEILPTGELQNAAIVKASGNTNYDQSVLRAIEKVRRFAVPADTEVFEAGGFRNLNITFRPEDLMKP